MRELAESGLLEGERGGYRLAGPIDEIRVPASVQSTLAARIDRLPAPVKRVLQVAAVIGKEPRESTLAMVAAMEENALDAALRELIRLRLPLRGRGIYPERVLAFRHPLTQEVAYGSQLSEPRAAAHAATAHALIELEPERHDERAALISQHLADGGETLEAARWAARAAHWAGYSHPEDAMRLWARVSELADGLPESEEQAALAVSSRFLQVDYAWRLGMEKERLDALLEEAGEIATRTGDLRSQAMLMMLGSDVRPGLDHHADEWTSAAEKAIELADRSGDDALRVAIRAAGSYSHLCAGRWDDLERRLDEALEIAGDDHGIANGLVIGCPVAWAVMAKGVVRRERGELDEASELFETALRIAGEHGDPETGELSTRGNQILVHCYRGEIDEANALAQRNYEAVERLGDVFSRTWALANLGLARTQNEDYEGALEAVDAAESLYRDAMGSGGEGEGLRLSWRAEALIGLGRADEAVATAEQAVAASGDRGMAWAEVRAQRTLGRALDAAGKPGAPAAFDRATEVAQAIGFKVELDLIEEDRAAVGAGSN